MMNYFIRRFHQSHALFLFLSLMAAIPASAQSDFPIFRSLIYCETDFEIRVDNITAPTLIQGITKRAVYHPPVESSIDFSSERFQSFKAGAAGYEAYHLEFRYEGRLIDYTEVDQVEFRNGFEVIYKISIQDATRRMSNGNEPDGDIRSFAISLENVPLTILDSVDIINIRKRD